MKFLSLVLGNLKRKKLRTVPTILNCQAASPSGSSGCSAP